MSLKAVMLGLALAGLAGIGMAGGARRAGHDAERLVARPPAEVYSALSAMAPEGARETEAGLDGPASRLEVSKEEGAAVRYRLSVEGKWLASLDFTVAAEEDGRATRLAADIDFDESWLSELDRRESGFYRPVSEALVERAVRDKLAEMAAGLEAGRPLGSFGAGDLVTWRTRAAAEAEARELAERAPGAAMAPRPLGSAAPTLDPEAEARKYLDGGR